MNNGIKYGKISGIYRILNSEDNKFYIGSSIDINSRINSHKKLLIRNKHHSIHLQNAFNKYGLAVFMVDIIEICNESILREREQYYLDNIIDWSMCYNISKIASGNDLLNHPNKDKIYEKLSLKNKGVYNGNKNKPIIIDGIKYSSLSHAAKKFNVDSKTISYRVKNWKYKNYYYIDNPKIGEYNESYSLIYFYVKKERKEKKQYKRKYIPKPLLLRSVSINNIIYKSAKVASQLLSIEYHTLLYRLNSKTITFHNYYYLDTPKKINDLTTIEDINRKISEKNSGKNNKNCKPFIVNGKKYNTLKEASHDMKLSIKKIRYRLKNDKFMEYQYY